MERHHAAERHLYPELLQVFKQITEDHPGVIIGAVTDGRANPMFMTFTLAPYFDFCMSWEDDQGNRQEFFKQLGQVEGNVELKWIYDAALEKYCELDEAQQVMKNKKEASTGRVTPSKEKVWIHVGDDLAYDVGGAALSGAKTIYCELADQYNQTARHRFDDIPNQPVWSTTMASELQARKVMNEAAVDFIDARVNFLTRLPEAIEEILEQE
jgi:putative hydrolase of the HAD superfamily